MDRIRANIALHDTGSDSDIDMMHHPIRDMTNSNSEQMNMSINPDESYMSQGMHNEELSERVENLQSAVRASEILEFLKNLSIDNSKTGIALSWNRALKVLKLHNIISSEYKPWSQLRSGEKLDITQRVQAVQDEVIINDLKVRMTS